jgi:hypothetical protein
MWVLNHLVSMCYAHGYGKSSNCPTLKYIVLCHYTWRWVLSLDSKVWTKRLCLLARDNINYFGCDYGMCYFMCKTFYNVVGGRPRWFDMERPCVQLCTMHLLIVDGQMDPSLVVVLASLWCMLCEQVSRASTMLICDRCFWSWHMGCLMPPMEEVRVGKWFCPWCTR